VGVIPFYGAERPDLFAIERAAMDRPGRVTAAIDHLLPDHGLVVDIGAGTGFTAQQLSSPDRVVVPVEPAEGMWRPDVPLPWVGASAAALPFATGAFDAAYATWAYFFGDDECLPGLAELHRVVRAGGPIVIAQNAGDDEFTALSPRDITTDPAFFTARGFTHEVVATVFEFEQPADAVQLLRFYFGDGVPGDVATTLTYNVSLFVAASRGL
jgi:SAM-dependent methyltransferase